MLFSPGLSIHRLDLLGCSGTDVSKEIIERIVQKKKKNIQEALGFWLKKKEKKT